MSDGRRYRIIEVIGKGGFGTVYRSEMQGEGGFSKTVALKLLNAEASSIEEIASRLRDEARILGLIHHRAIVRVDGLTTLDGRWAVVMEYVDGVDLRHVLAAGPVPPGPSVEIVGEVAGALYVAHDKPTPDGKPLRLLHRDIKPSNIQITPAGEVKILDFGVARAEFQSREAHTQGMRFGTLRYLAPERLDGVDSAAGDIYALGVVLIECLTGKSFGKAIANRSAHQKRVDEALNRVWSQTRGVSQELVDVCEAMVAYDPNDRLTARDVERVCKELRAILQDEWLGDWAENVIPPLTDKRRAKAKADKLCGSVITEATSGSAGQIWQKGGAEPGAQGPRSVASKDHGDDPSLIFAKGGESGNVIYRQDTEETAPPPVTAPPVGPQVTQQQYEPTPAPAPSRAPVAPVAAPAPVMASHADLSYEEEGGSTRRSAGLMVAVGGIGIAAMVALLLVGGVGAAWYFGALDGLGGSGAPAAEPAVAEAPPPPPPPPPPQAAPADEAAARDAQALTEPSPPPPADTGSPAVAAATTRSSGGSGSRGSKASNSSSGSAARSTSSGNSGTSSAGSMVRPSSADDDAAADALAAEGEAEAEEESAEDLALCSNLLNLELMAGMGKLRSEHIQCLEKYISRSDSLNDKDKASRVLIANAQAGNSNSRWEMLVKRHLEEFDRSDPELAYGYAVALSKKGARGAQGAIRWSDVSLENRQVWTGEQHTTRVNALYQIKALASLSLYQQAAESFANNPTTEASKAEERYRNQTKTFAREWFEYAKAAGKDTSRAKALCDEAAGRLDFCE